MLINFTVGNFRSFNEPQTLSLAVANLVSKDRSVDDHNVTVKGSGIRLLKSAGIYGANASGKSNLIKALLFMRQFILDSSRESQANEPIDVEPFRLRLGSMQSPSLFEATFLADARLYRYGFELTSDRVVREWLYHVPAKIEAPLFIREGDNLKQLSRNFPEGRDLIGRTRPNALFLSVVAQFNGSIAETIVRWFRELGIDYQPFRFGRASSVEKFKSTTYRSGIREFVCALDLGISDIAVEEKDIQLGEDLPEGFAELRTALFKLTGGKNDVVSTTHSVFDSDGNTMGTTDFDLDQQESDGTRRLFDLSGPILDALKNGKVLFIDEIESHLHALVTQAIVDLFNSTDSNPLGAQLIFTTHDVKIMNQRKLRRDQIWFASKDQFGATRLISLAEYKPRNDASFAKDYLGGRYGAIPFIEELTPPIVHTPEPAAADA